MCGDQRRTLVVPLTHHDPGRVVVSLPLSFKAWLNAFIYSVNYYRSKHYHWRSQIGSSLAAFSGHILFGTVLKNIFFFLNQHLQIGRFHIKMCISSLWKIWKMCSRGPGFTAALLAGGGYRAHARSFLFAQQHDSPQQPGTDHHARTVVFLTLFSCACVSGKQVIDPEDSVFIAATCQGPVGVGFVSLAC